MKTLHAVLLMPEGKAEIARSAAAAAGIDLAAANAGSLEDLEAALAGPFELLLSFSTSVIVPESVLRKPGLVALNIHAASPEFPGRDPHHFAIYRGAKRYGATMHYMTEKVDDGQIVDVEMFDVPDEISAATLLAMADEAGIVLMRRFFEGYAMFGAPAPRDDIRWGGGKTTRRDFTELCQVNCAMPEAEFLRRLEATTMPGFNNLYVDIHGYRFRLEGRAK